MTRPMQPASTRRPTPRGLLPLLGGLGLLALGCLSACSGGDATESKTLTVNGDIPLVYVKRQATVSLNPTDGAGFAAGGDLMLREKSSPSAPEYNLTAQFTQGKGDASDPEVSYDGKKVVFAMNCPADNTAKIDGVAACTGHWNIWEYDMSSGGMTAGTFRRLTSSTSYDDVDPVYLPGGRGFVFSSNRQTKTQINQALGRSYAALDEYERERVLNLHTMDINGGAITQISSNQSHDRNPVIRPNGDIMFSRWDHMGDRNHFKIFRIKPDGTDMFVLYGAHSPGNTFLNPRDMDPKGSYKGFLSSDLMPLSRTHEGGALVLIDAANYSEQNTPAATGVPTEGGQKEITAQALNMDRGFSLYGRVTTPYPLWDGSDRVLLAYRPCEVTKNKVRVSCATLTAEEITRLGSERSLEEVATDTVKDDVPPPYAIYMFDPAKQTWLIVAAPPEGYMYTDPIALQVRTEPNVSQASLVDTDLAAKNMGVLEVRSVYDTDGLGRMGDAVLTAADLAAGCSEAIAKTKPSDSTDTRAAVADLARIKDPLDTAYGCAPARFVRAVRAVAPPSGTMGLRRAIGETNFEPQQILGYAPIEPDGSFKLAVPADTPIALAVVDSEGRAFQTHTNWIQVRPGERRTCDGCHSPRRGGSLNSGAVVNTLSAGLKSAMSAAHQSGETMASTRTRLDPSALQLASDLLYQDIWADTTQPTVKARPAITVRYTGNTNPDDDLATPAPVQGIINYPDHIQPLWTRNRGTGTCTGCHVAGSKLDLSGTVAGTGRVTSYEKLMLGEPLLDSNGKPVTQLREGVPELVRKPALVESGASEGDALGLARKSRLMEILAGQSLMSSSDARVEHPNPPSSAPNHASMLNAAERRLLAEWMDLGGKYYNDPFDSNSGVRDIGKLTQGTFTAKIQPILNVTCANGCHMAVGSGKALNFRDNRFVLTGSAEGDYETTLSMINDTCNAANNPLLTRPSSVPHPAGATNQTTAVLPNTSGNYATILDWIAGGCPKP